jgi:hypothetical protein
VLADLGIAIQHGQRARRCATIAERTTEMSEASKERDPVEVIAAVLKQVPQELTNLRAEIERLAENSAYFPPEYKWPIWVKLRNLLNVVLSWPPSTEWEKEIYRIVVQKEPPA